MKKSKLIMKLTVKVHITQSCFILIFKMQVVITFPFKKNRLKLKKRIKKTLVKPISSDLTF